MSSNDNQDLLEYRIGQLEELFKPLLTLVNDLERKLALLAQKIIISTSLMGLIVNGIGVWYSSGSTHSEPEKKSYYESRISDSEKIKLIEAELRELRAKTYIIK